MVSGKERLRLERQWNEMKERMDRQAAALTRLAALNTHLMAGLLEIREDAASLQEAEAIARTTLDAAEALRVDGSGNAADQQD